jgi:hypothetical protein
VFEFWDPHKADPSLGVGSRHHIVPKSYLQRFANNRGQVWVRSRSDQREPGLRSIADLAIKDLYTFTNTEGQPDGRFEQLLSYVEGNATQVLRRLTSPVMATRATSEDERIAISLLIAFQVVRGLRERRQIEITGDLAFRLEKLGPDNVTGIYEHQETGERIDLKEIVAVPDTNEHIKIASDTALKLFECLIDRPLITAELQAGGLLTCDEPVIIDQDSVVTQQHRPAGMSESAEVVHLGSPFGGIGISDEVALPIGRRWLLVLGPRGDPQPASPYIRLSRSESADVSRQANNAILRQAYETVISHPSDKHLLRNPLPDPLPLMHVCGLPGHFLATVDDQIRRRRTELRGRRR